MRNVDQLWWNKVMNGNKLWKGLEDGLILIIIKKLWI